MLQFFPVDSNNVYETLTNNDRLMQLLDSKELMLKEEMLYADYDKTILNFMKAQLKLENINTLKELATLLVNNDSIIVSNTMEYLIEHRTLFEQIKKVFGDMDIDEETYREIFYCYKYCYTSSFFQNNSRYFIPEYDIEQIENNEVLSPFMDAINKEFDKLDYMLNASRKYISFDDIPFDYINYLGQMLGFETKDIYSASEKRYRELMKNIIEIFKIKGTSYSFELFFQFLGFDIIVSEYYFDRRLFYRIDGYNPETKKIAKNDFEYFLTSQCPTKNILSNISVNEAITLSDFTPQYSLLEFNDLVSQYGVEAVLGYSNFDSDGNIYNDKIYKYFKSNYVYYDIGLLDRNLTQVETNSVIKYLEFLTPVFIAKKIQIRVRLGNEEEDQIKFDGDGKGDGTKIGELPDDFEMLDSEDWDKYNNDERTHDGIISGTKDSQYRYGERMPIVNRWSKVKTTRYDNEGLYPKLMFKRLLHWYDYDTAEWSIDTVGTDDHNPDIVNKDNGLTNEFVKNYASNRDQISFYKRQPSNSLDYNGPEGKNIDDWVRWNAYIERKVDYLLNKVEKNTVISPTNVDKIDINFTNPLNPTTVLSFTNENSFNEVRIEKSTDFANVLVAEFSYGVSFSHLYNIAYHFNSYLDLLNFSNGQQISNQQTISKYLFEGCYISVDNNNRIQIYQIVPSTLYTSLMFELYVEETDLGWNSSTQVLEQIPTTLNFLSIAKANETINKYKDTILDSTRDYWEKEKIIEEYARGLIFIQAQNRYYIIRKRILASGFVQIFPDSMFDTYADAMTFFNAHPNQCYNFRLFWVNENWVDTNTDVLYDRGYYRFVYKNRRPNITFYDDMTGYLYIFDRGIKPTDIQHINFKGKPVIENDKCVIYEYDYHWKGYSEEQDEDDFIFYNTSGQDAELDSNNRYYATFTDRHYIDYHNIHNFIYRPVFEIEERKFDESIDGIWMLEQILDRTVQAFSDGELHSHEKIGDQPTSLTGIIEDYLEEPGTTSLNTLRQYFTDVKKFVIEFYKYLVLRQPLPNDSLLINILGASSGNPPTYQYEEYWWNAIYDYTNQNNNTIVKAVYGFILNKIKEVLPQILQDAYENHAIVQPGSGNTTAELINKDIINWFNTYTYPGVFNKDYIDNYDTNGSVPLNFRITSDFFDYIQTFVNTYQYVGQYSTQKYISYILKFFNDYYDTFLTPYHEFLSLMKIFRQQVLVHSDPTNISSSLVTQTDPNIRYALKYYLLSVMYNEKLALYRERYMDDGELNASFKNFGEFEYIYYSPKAEFNGQYGFFNFPKTLEISKNNHKKDHYNSRNLPFYGFSMGTNNFNLNVSFCIKEDDYNSLLSSYYRITNILNYINSLSLSNQEKEEMKKNLTETYNAQFECIIPVLYLNEFDFSKKNTSQEGIAEQFQNIVFNKELSNISIQNTGTYILFNVSIPIDSKQISITVDESLKNYPIGYLRINYLKTVFKENVISIPYQNCHNWIKMDNATPSRFLSLGSADKIIRNVKNKILTTSDLFDQYKALNDFTGIKDIIGIGEDGNQYVNKVINLYEKNKQEFNTTFKITTKNIKDLNIKTIKLIYAEIYNFMNYQINYIHYNKYNLYFEEFIKKELNINNFINLAVVTEEIISKNINIDHNVLLIYTLIEIITKLISIKYKILYKELYDIIFPMPISNVNILYDIIRIAYKVYLIESNKDINILYNYNKPITIENLQIKKDLEYKFIFKIIASSNSFFANFYYKTKVTLRRFIEYLKIQNQLEYKFNASSTLEIATLIKFVAIAFGTNKIIYSTNGIIWSEGQISSVADWEGITYGNGKFVAVSSNNGKIAYSTNGTSWIEAIIPSNVSLESITYGNGKFVAVSGSNQGIALYSTDGINWNQTSMSTAIYFESVTYGNDMFVAVGQGGNVVAYSSNGETWNTTTLPNTASLYDITYGNGRFLAVGSNTAFQSINGTVWSEIGMPGSTTWRGITYNNGKFVIVGNNAAAYSTNGTAWYSTTIPNANWRSITYGDGKFVAVANNNTNVAYSVNGQIWSTTALSSNNDWRSIVYAEI